MIYQPIESSNLTSTAYDPIRQVLGVQFKSGRKFEYPAVSPDQHAEMMDAESVGSYFASNIRVRKSHTGVEIK